MSTKNPGPQKRALQNHLNSTVSYQAGLAGEADSAEKLGSSLLCLENWEVDKLFKKFTPVFWKPDCVLCPMCGPVLLPGKASQLNLWSGRSDLWHRLIKTLKGGSWLWQAIDHLWSPTWSCNHENFLQSQPERHLAVLLSSENPRRSSSLFTTMHGVAPTANSSAKKIVDSLWW